MAILKIARMGHPVLQSPAAPVDDPLSPEIAGLAADMMETLADADGVGLAAPQVHVPLRLVVFRVPGADRADQRYLDAGLDDDSEEIGLSVLINPVIEPIGGETAEAVESCLSLPGMSGLVERHVRILYSGAGLDGETVERQAEGFHARVVQHECDHLDGILYPMRIKDLSKFGYTEELMRAMPDRDREDEE